MTTHSRLHSAYLVARDALLAERVPQGHWEGELSTSALSTATAVMALHAANPFEHRECIDHGMHWLAVNQNADGGWGDTVRSFSNISTTMLCRAALQITGAGRNHPTALAQVEAYLVAQAGATPASRAAAIRARYGKDHTFSVPILMACAVAGLVPWDEVPRLPFEAAFLPQSWYRFARMPVVSYALPALIAIGQCIHAHRRSHNPIRNFIRRVVRGRTLRVLHRIQPSSGGYLEATPLTSFVTLALCSIRRPRTRAEQAVIEAAQRFLTASVRPDGSWPIDTNLATWVTTLSVQALASAGDLHTLDTKPAIRDWLMKQQYRERHPYTGAAPGGWAWTDLPGGVPDCDDTPGALLALTALGIDHQHDAIKAGKRWIESLRNRDGGAPTFCRGWSGLPFDRSGCDLTAHALRAVGTNAHNLAYLTRTQQGDGSWLPLWFGNQHAPDDINPVYGTCRVLAAFRDLGLKAKPECRRGVTFLLDVQNADGGWGGASNCPSSVEETALAVDVLIDLTENAESVQRGLTWLVEAVESGRFREASPIGFYFAKLWYFEKLYPLIFTVAALGRSLRSRSKVESPGTAP